MIKPTLTQEQVDYLIEQVLQPPPIEDMADDESCKCIDSYGCGVKEALTNVVKILNSCVTESLPAEQRKFPEPGCFNEFNPSGMPYE